MRLAVTLPGNLIAVNVTGQTDVLSTILHAISSIYTNGPEAKKADLILLFQCAHGPALLKDNFPIESWDRKLYGNVAHNALAAIS